MGAGGFSKARLDRMHDVMAGHVEHGGVPGLVTLISRRGEVHIDAIRTKAAGGNDPMRRDTIFRIASISKPITAAATMILVEECKLRLDEPVDRLLPKLANRKVLKRLDGPVDDTIPAKRPIAVRDLLTLMLLNKGKHGRERILSRPLVETMTTDHLTAEQKAASPFPGLWDNRGWGFGVSVVTHRDSIAATPGQYGWNGGFGTSWNNDPVEEMIGIVMSKRAFTSPIPPDFILDFWTLAYQAIDD